MAYVKTTWADGQAPALSASNLNKIEQGIFDASATADAAKSTADADSLIVNAMADYVIEEGTDSNWKYRKWNSGRLEAEWVWNVGQYTLNTTEVSPIRVGADLTAPTPSIMTSGSVRVTLLGNSSNSPIFIEHYTDVKFRIAKVSSSNVTLQGLTLGLTLLNARWD